MVEMFFSFPYKLKLFCDECEEETMHVLTGFAKWGIVYTCQECGRKKILSKKRVEYELKRQYLFG